MTELHWGLIGLGAVVVAFVVVYNTWQEYRRRKLAKELLDIEYGDPLFDGRVAPKSEVDPLDELLQPLPGEEAFGAPAMGAADGRVEPGLPRADDETGAEDVLEEGGGTGASGDHAAPGEKRDGRITPPPGVDYIAAFETEEPVPAYRIAESTRDLAGKMKKQVFRIGYDERLLRWETLSEGGRNEDRIFRVGVQLVDRRGAIPGGDLSFFHLAMRELADEFTAVVQVPGVEETLEAAGKLDAFCESVDIQIGLNIASGAGVFEGKDLRLLAEAAGMALEGNGRFVRQDGEGNVLYSMINRESPAFSGDSLKTLATRGVTFLLDVPRTPVGERAFGQMLDLAKHFARTLDGSLVDDNGAEVSEALLEPVRLRIIHCQSMMAAAGLPAGSALARRLFS
ncbi:MAG: cell division protein ZipA C-terminal FtsZ-binding domain-containing protein [Candidatus Accumulibacter sp.]|jgi:hypothetical protein|nr:cell division protein ZipA C-terminal FtsZ-binding domain-containing protein [Accumulibacter sp.]